MNISIDRTVTIILTDKEAHLLQGILQNPNEGSLSNDISIFSQELFLQLRDANGQ